MGPHEAQLHAVLRPAPWPATVASTWPHSSAATAPPLPAVLRAHEVDAALTLWPVARRGHRSGTSACTPRLPALATMPAHEASLQCAVRRVDALSTVLAESSSSRRAASGPPHDCA